MVSWVRGNSAHGMRCDELFEMVERGGCAFSCLGSAASVVKGSRSLDGELLDETAASH